MAEEDSTVIAPEPPLPSIPEPAPEPLPEPEPVSQVADEPPLQEAEPEPAPAQPTGSGMAAVGSGMTPAGSGMNQGQDPALDPLHAADDEEVFVTASGKIIRVKKNRIVTAQTKRKVIRAGIMAAIAAVFAVILIIGAVALSIVNKDTGPDAKELERQRIEARNKLFGYDPNKNPFTLTQPNFLGLTLKPSFVIVLDASSTTSSWFGQVADAIPLGLKNADAKITGQVTVAADGGPKFYPAEPKPIDSAVVEDIASNLMNTYANGSGDIAQAVDASLSGKPSQIIIVTNDTGMPAHLGEKLADLLKDRPEVVIDIIVINANQRRDDLDKLIQSRKGQYVLLTAGRIAEWRKEAP